MKLLKVFETLGRNIEECYIVQIPDNFEMDYHYYSVKAIQKMTNNKHICGTQIYDEKFDSAIPENKKIYDFFELHKLYN